MERNPLVSRRRMLLGVAGLTAAAGMTYRCFGVGRALMDAYPALVLPVNLPTVVRERLLRLHARYGATRAASGVAAMRRQIMSDVRVWARFDDWLEMVADWIHRAAWNDAADLCVDIAEAGGADVRRSCAMSLAMKESPLLTANACQPRIVRLDEAETDGGASGYWKALRKQLAI